MRIRSCTTDAWRHLLLKTIVNNVTLRHFADVARVAKPTGRKSLLTTVKSMLSKTDLQTSTFEKDYLGRVVVYTDGCCLSNHLPVTSNRRAGIGVYWGADHPFNCSLPIYGDLLTCNRAEVLAAHTAVIIAKELQLIRLCLCTDSTYVINGCTDWLLRWSTHGWLTGKGTAVKNTDLWKPFSADLKLVFTTFTKGDSDNDGIQQAHKLANEAALK